MSNLKVVCLISGGKDSTFSILHCLANGHDVVALANLYPAHSANQDMSDDIDSYMYQTIGHTVIPLYEKAFGLPLYRQEIFGGAVNQDKSYGPVAAAHDDESESLIPLLLKVKARHPEVNAVSTGAILSDYQRTRVESVAMRLGLTSLSYLWQYPSLPPFAQTSLLQDMADVGQDSRIIKVASGGLDGTFLWLDVADLKSMSRLERASKRFGSADDGAVLGEGGEYETLAVAGPAPLWKGRICIHPDHRDIVNSGAGSAYLRVVDASLEVDGRRDDHPQSVRIPPLLEPHFESILAGLRKVASENAYQAEDHLDGDLRETINSSRTNRLHITNESNAVSSGQTLLRSITGKGKSAEEQMHSLMGVVNQSLQAEGCSFADVAYTSIILGDMKDFLAINAVYGTYFQYPNPPARVTIACAAALPADKHLMVSFTVTKPSDTKLKKGLHVQSRSYWAPANIGPYSQAISIPIEDETPSEDSKVVYISGQIPLIPASMELAASSAENDDSFLYQCILALQHAVRVGRAMQVRRYLSTVVFIVADSDEMARSRSDMVREVWQSFHRCQAAVENNSDGSDDPSFDVWDQKYGPRKHHGHAYDTPEVKEIATTDLPQLVPALHVIWVDALPRNATAEWVTYGLTKEFDTPPAVPHLNHLLRVFQANLV